MSLTDQFRQQTLPIFRHVYLRLQELEQLSTEEWPPSKVWNLSGNDARQESPFRSSFHSELERVRDFIDSYSEELWIRLCGILDRLDRSSTTLKTSNRRTLVNHEALELLQQELIQISDSLISLEEFQRQNVLFGALLIQQHETRIKKRLTSITEVDPEMLLRVEGVISGDRSFDAVLLALSTAFSGIRKLRDQVSGEETIWKPPDTFTRNTKKYWIHPADVLRVKCKILQNLPILIFGKSPKLSSATSKLMPLRRQDRQDSSCSLISSVYFDNEDLQTYHDRLVREHGASLIRIRWYGVRSIDPEDSVYIERKVHRDGWTGEASYKVRSCFPVFAQIMQERAPIQGKEVLDFIQGKTVPSMNEANPKTGLLQDLQNQILSRKERPNLRTEYRRIAFQESTSNTVRMSLDTDLRMIKEGRAGQDHWCRSIEQDIPKEQEIIQFPYAVFEIKLQTEDPPEWVSQLLSSGLLTEVPKFSKFLHGTAKLFGSRIRNSPSWFLLNIQGFMDSATLEEMSNPVDSFSKKAADFLFPPKLQTGQETNSSVLQTPQKMQVSTLCHVPDNHTVLSEVVVLNSGIQNSSNSHRVLHHNTSVHGPAPVKTRWRGICPWKKPEEQDHRIQNPADENRAPALVRTRIEPKTFFANERTFLSWLTVAVMVMFLGLSLLDSSTARGGLGVFGGGSNHCREDSPSSIQVLSSNSSTIVSQKSEGGVECNVARISGALIAPMALILMIYALIMYRKRTIQILRRETVRYDDFYGPIILTLLLVIVLFLSYILSIA